MITFDDLNEAILRATDGALRLDESTLKTICRELDLIELGY